MVDETKLEQIAKETRKDIILMLSNGGHFGGSLSSVEILVTIYFQILDKDDKFILSKAHASAALYSILSRKGLLDRSILKTYGKKDSRLGVHAEKHLVPGVEFSCGSLGHGLPFATGIALANKMKKKNDKVFVLVGDGESQEGSIWEAAMFAAHNKLDNLIAIVDHNKLQSMDKIKNVIDLNPFPDKWKSFGWHVLQADGHDFSDLIKILKTALAIKNKPIVIIAHTIKGKGLSFLENSPRCHYISLNEEEMKIAKNKYNITEKELSN